MKKYTLKTEEISKSDFTEREKQIFNFGFHEGYEIGECDERERASGKYFWAAVFLGGMVGMFVWALLQLQYGHF